MATTTLTIELPNVNMSYPREYFIISGMMCASYPMTIENVLKMTPGIIEVEVNLATEIACITFDPKEISVASIIQDIDEVGYKAIKKDLPEFLQFPKNDDNRAKDKQRKLTRKLYLLIFSVFITVPIVILSMGFINSFNGSDYSGLLNFLK